MFLVWLCFILTCLDTLLCLYISSLCNAQHMSLQNNPNTKFLLDSDTEGTSGIFQPEVKEPEHCNAGATAFFEYRLLSVSFFL